VSEYSHRLGVEKLARFSPLSIVFGHIRQSKG
jgi:hypothetical protein